MENKKEIMEKHLERAELHAKLFRELGKKVLETREVSEVEQDMIAKLFTNTGITMSESILSACMEGIVGRFPVNRALLPFLAGAFGAARELCLNSLCGEEKSEKDRAVMEEWAADVSQMLVEESTVVTAKIKVEEDQPE